MHLNVAAVTTLQHKTCRWPFIHANLRHQIGDGLRERLIILSNMAIAVVYRLLSGFVFLSFALIAPIVAASSTPGSSGLGIKAGGISGGISLRNGYAYEKLSLASLDLISVQIFRYHLPKRNPATHSNPAGRC
jgi:hypothetical protein